jgi:lipoprotein-anchoring transpeptidase ErfK/SrfK
VSSRDIGTKQFLNATKPFWRFRANVLKRFTGTDHPNDALGALARRALKQGTIMFNSARLNSRLVAAALGALTIGAIAFSTSAAAAPLPLFPFIFSPPVQSAPPQAALAPYDDEGTVTELPARLKRQIVSYPTREAPGTIIIDTPNTYLYYVLGGGQAIRYGIGVGRDGFTWSGTQTIVKKAEWPDWTPPPEMIARQPYLPRYMAGGPGNPLGARAMYLGGTIYRIHGTNAPGTIGTRVSSGCLRLTNEDVTDLYSRVNVGTKVIVLPMDRRADNTDGKRS